MQELTHILTPFSASAAAALVSAIWQGTLLAAAVALCLHFVRGIPAAVRSILWTAVLLLVVLLHLIPFFGVPFFGTRSTLIQAPPASAFHADPRWSLAIVCLWAILSAARAAQLIHSAIGLRRLARMATPAAAPPEIAALLRTGLRNARLCTSLHLDRPSVIGFFAPRVLIPRSLMEKLSPSELEQIVMHEMEHLRRGDDWINLFQKLALVLFPLNPALLWVERRLCVERELACDDRVLQLTRARKAYATCLVNLAEHSVLRHGASLVLGAWERQSELGRRVRRILRQPEGVMSRRRMKFVTAALILGMVGGAANLAREPRLVSFAPSSADQITLPAQASLAAPPSYVPASFKVENRQPRVIQTVFHQPGLASAAAPGKPTRRVTPRPARKTDFIPHPSAVRAAMQPRAWVVLTNWTDSPLQPRIRLLVSGENQPSYAALPFGNGWLIVQL